MLASTTCQALTEPQYTAPADVFTPHVPAASSLYSSTAPAGEAPDAAAAAAAASLAQIPEVLELELEMSPREVLQELLGDLWVEPQNLVMEGPLGGWHTRCACAC
jgi:hypothetical protein